MTNKDLRIVFLGTPDFAVESLRRLYEGGYNIVGVITMPDKIGGRGNQVIESAVKKYAKSVGLKVLQPEKLKDTEFLQQLRDLDADLQIVIAFRMLPEVVWNMPKRGTFNLHASLLPRYRGAAPINRAIMNGENITGVTTFMLKHELDTGDILKQVKVEIGAEDNAEVVHDKLMTIGADLVIETVNEIIEGNIKPIPQEELIDKNIQPCDAPKIFKEDCKINWEAPAQNIYNQIRGLAPYPGAWCTLKSTDGALKETTIKIYKTSQPEKHNMNQMKVGEAKIGKHTLSISCGDNKLIEIYELQPAGKKRMSADEFLRGLKTNELIFC